MTSSNPPTPGADLGTVQTYGHRVLAASKLDGYTVYSSDDKDVGKIKEIMLDMHSGRIAYAVLSSGGFLGIGDKLLAIPWHALTLDPELKSFKLSISSERIRHAPGFDQDSWPSMTDQAWANSVHEYYGNESNMERNIISGGGNLPGAATSTDTDRDL